MARNKLGQITGTGPVEAIIKKSLLAIAKDEGIKLKAMVRDELEKELSFQVYTSYKPVTKKGKDTQYYNKTHKHQKVKPYHHTGKLARNIYAVIDGNNVKAMVRDEEYDNGVSTTEVYDYLKFGTTDTPKNDTYSYDGGKNFSKYIPQGPHNFEARTREHMRDFLNKVEIEIRTNGSKNINPRYLKKQK